MKNRVRPKDRMLHILIGLICFVLVGFFTINQTISFFGYQHQTSPYSLYLVNNRLPDIITQLFLVTLALIFFIKYLIVEERSKVAVITPAWCSVGALASFLWAFNAFFQYPPLSLPSTVYWVHYYLPALLSTLLMLGTAIFFFITSNYTVKKIFKTNYIKIDPKIDKDTRKKMLEEISPLNLKNLIDSLTCLKCGVTAKLSFYPIPSKSSSRKVASTSYTVNSFEAPVCDVCRGLFDSWYFIHRKTKRHVLRTIGIIISLSFFGGMATFYIFLYIIIAILPLLLLMGVIIIIISIIRRKKSFRDQNSPYKNVKIYSGNRVRVRPDNFKNWVSLQDWVLYNLMVKESGDPPLTDIETTLLNYLNDNKGSAFSPSALIKRTIGDNFTVEYEILIDNTLKKMAGRGIIDYNSHEGKIHYFKPKD